MAKERMRLVDSTIQRELSQLISRDVAPNFGCLITLTGVKTSTDLKFCNVYISIMGGKEELKQEVIDYLEENKEEYFLFIGKRVRMKYTPVLRFHLDDTPEKAADITGIIDSLNIPSAGEEESGQ